MAFLALKFDKCQAARLQIRRNGSRAQIIRFKRMSIKLSNSYKVVIKCLQAFM